MTTDKPEPMMSVEKAIVAIETIEVFHKTSDLCSEALPRVVDLIRSLDERARRAERNFEQAAACHKEALCWYNEAKAQGRGGDIKSHAPACPNAAPKTSEAPEEEPKCLPDCERNCWSGQDKHAYGCPVAALFYLDLKEPAPAPEPKLEPCSVCGLIPDNKRHCCPHVHNPYAPAPEPRGGEEPIDWEKAELWAAGTAQGDARLSQVQAARAFIALRAEVERLKKLHSDHCSNPICEGPRS